MTTHMIIFLPGCSADFNKSAIILTSLLVLFVTWMQAHIQNHKPFEKVLKCPEKPGKSKQYFQISNNDAQCFII